MGLFQKSSRPAEWQSALPIVRTTGTDDVLAAALLWELWLRGVNRDLGYVDSWWTRMFDEGQRTA